MTRQILFLMTAMLVLGVSTTAFVNAQEMPTSVEVTSFPFNESVMENGKITFNNTNGTSTMNFVAYGWFDGTVRIGESLTIELPTKDCGTTCFVEGIYYIKDLNQGDYSELQIVAAPEPEPEPIPVTTSIANAERWNIEVYGDELQNIVDVKQSDTLRFVGDPDGLKGFEIYDKRHAPNTSNCQSGYDAAEYSVCVMSFAEFTLGGHEWFDRTTDTWGKFYVHPAETTGNGTMEVHVYEIPFDVTILEGGKVVYHNLDPVTYHNLEHTGTTGTEKGGTFSMWAGSNGGTATANFPVENCSSCYPAGVYSWKDSVSGVTGTITILPNPNTVNEQVGIQENVVVVLNKPEPVIQTNSTVTTEQQDILDKTKSYKTLIEEKINSKIQPLQAEIVDLRTKLVNVENEKSVLDEQREKLTNQITNLRLNATISETKYLEESELNKKLQEKISTLESQVVDTSELEKYKKEASNWRGVALEQLRVMAEILGLF